MSNADLYHFADFTRENYRRLLRIAKENYAFHAYTDFQKNERFIIWRHDVDFSPHAARKIAQIEADEGIKSTYFLLLHSEFYNLLEREVTDCLRAIFALGHYPGLHFDSHYYDICNEEQLEVLLLREKRILEEVFEQEIRIFCFHITTPFTLQCRNWQYAGIINAHAEYFHKNVGYCSDSNGYWRFRRLEDVLRAAKDERLQILTHPEMWCETVMSPKQRVYRCIEGRAEKTRQWYDTTLKKYGRENIDWE